MKTSCEIFESISNYLDFQRTHLTYNKKQQYSQKYIKGKLTAIDFLQSLLYHFIKKEISLKDDFINEINKNKKSTQILNNLEYKKGIHDTLEEIIKRIK